MNSKQWLPPPHHQAQGAIAIQDLFSMYATLAQIKEPSDTIEHVKAKFEAILLNFADSLTPGAPTR